MYAFAISKKADKAKYVEIKENLEKNIPNIIDHALNKY